nr:Uncharacterised protein [Salmonella sp. NCTC 7297]
MSFSISMRCRFFLQLAYFNLFQDSSLFKGLCQRNRKSTLLLLMLTIWQLAHFSILVHWIRDFRHTGDNSCGLVVNTGCDGLFPEIQRHGIQQLIRFTITDE